MNARALALPLALAAACAPRFDPRLVDVPVSGRSWVSTEYRSHPLVGKIWDVRASRFVDEGTLDSELVAADFVALGETHDNPDHHLLQARFVRAITASGRRPALGFEMLTADQQDAVDAAVAKAPRDPDALGQAVGWDASGWPEFAMYRPIFAAGLEAGLPIVAANLRRDEVKAIFSNGRDALDERLRARLARDEPIPDTVMADLREEMSASHCGELPDKMLEPLVLAQRARDARMAERMETAGGVHGGILVTGSGHARTDRAVPALVAKDAPGRKVISIAFFEVNPEKLEPGGYDKGWGKGPLPFDFVVFTPGMERPDPCAGFKEHLERRRKQREAADANPGKSAAPDATDAAPGAAKPPAP
jgi:uncharacterized iron-regulated protein